MSGAAFGSSLRNKIAYHPQINSDRFKNVFLISLFLNMIFSLFMYLFLDSVFLKFLRHL